jgi:transporter family-2 protein
VGAVMGFAIMITPVFLVPRIGATSTLTGLVMGQLLLALVLDHFGFLSTPKIEISAVRVGGVILLIIGAYLISR